MKTNPHPATPPPRAEAGGSVPRPGRLVRAALRVSLFWKIVLANGTIMAVVSGVVLVARVGPAADRVSPLALALAVLATLAVGSGVSAFLVSVALRPLDDLYETLEKVRGGDLDARVPVSPVTDPRVEALQRATNDMLDQQSRERARHFEASRKLLTLEARDRARIAGELYDGSAQTLAGVLVRLRILLQRARAEADRESLEALSAELREGLEALRLSARQLHPPELGELGVAAALAAHARHLAEDGGVAPVFRGSFDETRLSPEGRAALFRIVQEALDNAVHHSGGDSVTVFFCPSEEGLTTTVQDDGTGFDVARATGPASRSLGILTMIERAGYARGRTVVESAPGWGTRVELFLPWGLEARDIPREAEEPEADDDWWSRVPGTAFVNS